MKIFYLIAGLLLVGLVTESNAQTAPRNEFALQLSKNSLEIKPGTSTEITLNILRSKAYSRSKAKLGFSSSLPEGITVTFEPADGLIESSVATISVAENAKPGQYQFIVNAELNRVVKGLIVKVQVTEKKGTEIVTVN